MFDELSDKLNQVIKTVSGQGRLTELNVVEAMREIRRALLDADVNYAVARDFTNRVRETAMGLDVIAAVNPGQLMKKVVYDELVRLMGENVSEVKLANPGPTVILIAGLQGSGKTTFSGKLAGYFKRKGRNPLLVACDVYRPAAVQQLETLGKQLNVPVLTGAMLGLGADAVAIAAAAPAYARQTGRDVVILDTAGRLHVDEAMMAEVEAIKSQVKPHEILFVVDSMTGQDAVNTAKTFNERLDFSGVVLTKLDGDTRGGAAVSIRTVVAKPIKFVSAGEKLDTLDPFYPDRMAQRILGMGDIVSFVERAHAEFDEKQAAKLQKKLIDNDFTLQDFYEQLQQIKKMGSLSQLAGMIPGLSQAMKGKPEIDDDATKSVEAIILSMTKAERANPQILNGSRRKRIAKGSGTSVQQVNQLVKQFFEMRKMMKQMSRMMQSGRGLPKGLSVKFRR